MHTFKEYTVCICRKSLHVILIGLHQEFISWSKCQCALLIIPKDASLGFWLFLKIQIFIIVLQTLDIILLEKPNSLVELKALNISKVQIAKYDFYIM